MTLLNDLFPGLTPANHRITNPATPEYNCIAWAAEDTEHWWQPGKYWLPKDDGGVAALEQVFLAWEMSIVRWMCDASLAS